MRLIEFIFIITVCFVIIQPKRKVVAAFWVFFVLHFFIDKLRWQLFPVYGIALLYTILIFTGVELKRKRFRIPFSLLLTFGVFAGFVMPVFNLPKPTGEYSIGTKVIYFTDESREEIFTDSPDDKREIKVQVWYPSDNVTGIPEDYIDDKMVLRGVSKAMGYPFFLFDHQALVKSHSYPMATMSEKKDKFPVVIFSHGYVSFIEQNRVLFEELTSQGYIVISIGHYYDAAGIKSQDGSIVYSNEKMIKDKIQEWLDNKELFKKEYENRNIRGTLELSKLDNINVKIRGLDVVSLLDRLPEINNKDLNNKLDLEKVAIVGHSYGGATAVESCLLDKRLKVGVSLDGNPYGSFVEGGLINQPFMFINAKSDWDWTPDIKDQFTNDYYSLQIESTNHMDFSDTPLISPLLRFVGLSGNHNANRIIDVVNNHVIDFLDHYLKYEEIELIYGQSDDYPEVEYNELLIAKKK